MAATVMPTVKCPPPSNVDTGIDKYFIHTIFIGGAGDKDVRIPWWPLEWFETPVIDSSGIVKRYMVEKFIHRINNSNNKIYKQKYFGYHESEAIKKQLVVWKNEFDLENKQSDVYDWFKDIYALIGHSYGGQTAVAIAVESGFTFDLLITADPVGWGSYSPRHLKHMIHFLEGLVWSHIIGTGPNILEKFKKKERLDLYSARLLDSFATILRSTASPMVIGYLKDLLSLSLLKSVEPMVRSSPYQKRGKMTEKKARYRLKQQKKALEVEVRTAAFFTAFKSAFQFLTSKGGAYSPNLAPNGAWVNIIPPDNYDKVVSKTKLPKDDIFADIGGKWGKFEMEHLGNKFVSINATKGSHSDIEEMMKAIDEKDPCKNVDRYLKEYLKLT